MTATDIDMSDPDKTQPPVSVLRNGTPQSLYRQMPILERLTQCRPNDDEDMVGYVLRLASSATPEEAIMFAAFAAKPKPAIWWGYECLRRMGEGAQDRDRDMMDCIAIWTQNPTTQNRFRAMQKALYDPVRSATVHLGLAVGWSGGPIGPNDSEGVPAHRTPRAVGTAVLSALATQPTVQRAPLLADCVDQAVSLFRLY